MKSINSIKLVICLFLVTSCSSTNHLSNSERILRNIQFCYDGLNTGLDSLIPIDGVYRQFNYFPTYNPQIDSYYIKDTTEINLWFLKDGTFKKVNKRINQIFWGNYKVSEDTIKVYSYQIRSDRRLFPFRKNYLHGIESGYLIDDEKKLELIYDVPMYYDDTTKEKYVLNEMEMFMDRYSKATFITFDSLPRPVDSPLMKFDWYNCK